MNKVLMLIAIGESLTGIALLVAPGVVAGLLFGGDLTGSGVLFARMAGIALIGLGTACWPGPPSLGMLAYGLLVAIYLVWVGLTQDRSGFFLWPAVVLHGILAVPLALSIRQGR